jgi:acyl-CoA synthetase (AMP-forming)/AMP-acid ligase II
MGEMETLASRLRTTAQTRLEHPAIIDHGRVLTYQWLLSSVQGLATRLTESGAGPGMRVALMLPNGASFVSAFFAVAHVGGIVVPLNPALRESEVASVIEDAQVSMVLTVRELRERCVQALRSAVGLQEDAVIAVEELGHSGETSADRIPAAPWPPEGAESQTPALYLYSSAVLVGPSASPEATSTFSTRPTA